MPKYPPRASLERDLLCSKYTFFLDAPTGKTGTGIYTSASISFKDLHNSKTPQGAIELIQGIIKKASDEMQTLVKG